MYYGFYLVEWQGKAVYFRNYSLAEEYKKKIESNPTCSFIGASILKTKRRDISKKAYDTIKNIGVPVNGTLPEMEDIPSCYFKEGDELKLRLYYYVIDRNCPFHGICFDTLEEAVKEYRKLIGRGADETSERFAKFYALVVDTELRKGFKVCKKSFADEKDWWDARREFTADGYYLLGLCEARKSNDKADKDSNFTYVMKLIENEKYKDDKQPPKVMIHTVGEKGGKDVVLTFKYSETTIGYFANECVPETYDEVVKAMHHMYCDFLLETPNNLNIVDYKTAVGHFDEKGEYTQSMCYSPVAYGDFFKKVGNPNLAMIGKFEREFLKNGDNERMRFRERLDRKYGYPMGMFRGHPMGMPVCGISYHDEEELPHGHGCGDTDSLMRNFSLPIKKQAKVASMMEMFLMNAESEDDVLFAIRFLEMRLQHGDVQ